MEPMRSCHFCKAAKYNQDRSVILAIRALDLCSLKTK